jgi:hypothetical protein
MSWCRHCLPSRLVSGVTARFRQAVPRGLGLGRSLLARPADALTDPTHWRRTRHPRRHPERRSRPCCPLRAVRRLGLRDPCPTPAASATCRRTVTAPALARIQPPGRRGVEEGVVFMGVAFRGLPVGRSQLRLPQSRDRALQGSAHYRYCVHGSHLLPMDHEHGNARTPATRCAIGIKPVAVWLSNAPTTATPSSVMGRISHLTESQT